MLNWRNLLQSGGDAGAGCHNRPLTQSLLSHDDDADDDDNDDDDDDEIPHFWHFFYRDMNFASKFNTKL